MLSEELKERLKGIKVLAMDVDGVLTSGEMVIFDDGSHLKAFYAHDGLATRAAVQAGLTIAWISAHDAPAILHRAKNLGVPHVIIGTFQKVTPLQEILEKIGRTFEETAYIGDDVSDIPPMKRCAASFAVANATEEVKQHADYVTKAQGGRGAVREVIELILKAQGKWEKVIGELVGDEHWFKPG